MRSIYSSYSINTLRLTQISKNKVLTGTHSRQKFEEATVASAQKTLQNAGENIPEYLVTTICDSVLKRIFDTIDIPPPSSLDLSSFDLLNIGI